jgi:FkbM family methyltransferase
MPDIYTNPLFVNLIDASEVNTIIEMGSSNNPSWKTLNEAYSPDEIYAIEAHPMHEKLLKEQLLEFDNVDFTLIALGKKNCKIDFWLHPDAQSSSVYNHPRDECELIEIDCITLSKFCEDKKITKIDLICADVEGSEAEIFKNQEIMKTVKYIISEVKLHPEWKGGDFPGFEQLTDAIEPYGFKLAKLIPSGDHAFGDGLWINENNTGISTK